MLLAKHSVKCGLEHLKLVRAALLDDDDDQKQLQVAEQFKVSQSTIYDCLKAMDKILKVAFAKWCSSDIKKKSFLHQIVIWRTPSEKNPVKMIARPNSGKKRMLYVFSEVRKGLIFIFQEGINSQTRDRL